MSEAQDLEPWHPPDVHATEALFVNSLLNEAMHVTLHRQGQARYSIHPDVDACQAACTQL